MAGAATLLRCGQHRRAGLEGEGWQGEQFGVVEIHHVGEFMWKSKPAAWDPPHKHSW